MQNPVKLSVLDQSPVKSGLDAYSAIDETLGLATLCDNLGYHRYWVAEHHASDALAGCSPEVLLGRLGAETKDIRLGSGGIMLPHYSPYKVAENFRMLETMYPSRIDLGIGRAPGTDPFTAAAIRYGSTVGPEHFPNMVLDLQALLNDTEPVTPGLENAQAFPKVETPPELWMLGSSSDSSSLAAVAGLPYNFAHFINPMIGPEIFENYRENFQAGPNWDAPHSVLTIFTICAETEKEALELSKSRDLWFIRLLRGNPGPFPSVKEASDYPYSGRELQVLEENQKKRAIGTPEQVCEKLESYVKDFELDELMILTITHSKSARSKSYELLYSNWN
tara:strand:- start:360 stop:1364 length:1005 start_codon:yes stop_codon:yes gene_type:complete